MGFSLQPYSNKSEAIDLILAKNLYPLCYFALLLWLYVIIYIIEVYQKEKQHKRAFYIDYVLFEVEVRHTWCGFRFIVFNNLVKRVRVRALVFDVRLGE